MLIQGTDYNIFYNTNRIEFVNRKKNAMYSMWGDDIPTYPKPKFFPETKENFQMLSWMKTTSNPIVLKSDGYGYHCGNLSIKSTDTLPLAYKLDSTRIDNLNDIKSFGYGYHSSKLNIIASSDTVMNNVSLSDNDFNPINFFAEE